MNMKNIALLLVGHRAVYHSVLWDVFRQILIHLFFSFISSQSISSSELDISPKLV